MTHPTVANALRFGAATFAVLAGAAGIAVRFTPDSWFPWDLVTAFAFLGGAYGLFMLSKRYKPEGT